MIVIMRKNSQSLSPTISAQQDPANSVQDSRQAFFPVKDFSKSKKDWRSSGGVYVVYAKGVKRITLQRVLVSKLVFEKEKFQSKESLVIFDNILILQDMVKKDPGFKKKFGSSLEDLAKILKKSRFQQNPTRKTLENLSRELRTLDGFLIPHRNLAQTEKHFKGKFEVRQGVKSGIPKDQLPVPRFIGIGYKDKGSARNRALDGVPSWQEYCRARLWENLK
jgi:hypothetical protein